MTSTGDHRVVACTVATRAQLSATRALGTSYLRQHPEHDFVVVDLEDPPDWLGISEDEYFELATAYDVGELAEVITPQVVRGLLEKYDVVVKLPPRALVLAPLAFFGSPGFVDLSDSALAHWNLHERPLEGANLIRFDDYDLSTPWVIAPGSPQVLFSERPELKRIYDEYASLVEPHDAPYRFGFLADGTPITAPMRTLFDETRTHTNLLNPTGEKPPHAFDGDHFREWLRLPATPIERVNGFNRLVLAVWRSRVDLQVAFPHPFGPGFRQWCRLHGTHEGLPEWALPGEPLEPAAPIDQFGVNVAGYHTAELGVGEMGRVMLRVLEAAEVPHVSVVEEHSITTTVRTALEAPTSIGAPRFPVSLITVNGDFTAPLLEANPEVGHDRYRIGLWAWELEDFPASMHHGYAHVDEIWTVSEFSRRAISAHSPVPVHTIPVPVPDPGEPRREPSGRTRFLFAFDYNSTAGRKNPYGLVTAFQAAFEERDDVELVIKSTNSHSNVASAERLRLLVAGDERITLLERYLTVGELADLYATSHAYVSLHRGEGFGLTVAEAMIRAIPVISTDYSGTAEFVTPETGWPIPYSTTEVGPGWAPYPAGARWADPDLDSAARAMREVADDPKEARRRGVAGRAHLLRTRQVDAAASWVAERLTAAHEEWRARHEPVPVPVPPSLARRVARRIIRTVRSPDSLA
ncbi:Glycosyl transferases group 1 [Lentzea albidocapillata subsp. violacea]|uniref:Glycosyl transferases group 1 n=1 Tax=Lentzea albidocapillata subsp. violacea TaxID=128104 RepID=A0A1G9DEL5_9PSEU|nr:Glycosyl transferases group 1 [Lentzea albidocapillata subsp. violacea]